MGPSKHEQHCNSMHYSACLPSSHDQSHYHVVRGDFASRPMRLQSAKLLYPTDDLIMS